MACWCRARPACELVLVRRFDPEAALALVEAEHVSFLAGPPTFFVAMAHALTTTTCPLSGSSRAAVRR